MFLKVKLSGIQLKIEMEIPLKFIILSEGTSSVNLTMISVSNPKNG